MLNVAILMSEDKKKKSPQNMFSVNGSKDNELVSGLSGANVL